MRREKGMKGSKEGWKDGRGEEGGKGAERKKEKEGGVRTLTWSYALVLQISNLVSSCPVQRSICCAVLETA